MGERRAEALRRGGIDYPVAVHGLEAGEGTPHRQEGAGLLFARLAQHFLCPVKLSRRFNAAGPWGDTSTVSLAPSTRGPLPA